MSDLTAGRELDALVGLRIMDWRWMQLPGLRDRVMQPPEQWQSMTNGAIDLYTVHNCDDNPPERLPRYSTDIASAWLVVEKMRGRGWSIRLVDDVQPGHAYIVEFWQDAGPHTALDARESSAPLAICKAALSAVSVAEHQDATGEN